VYVIFQKRLDHEKEALANISTTKPQEIVRGLRMEAVKETKITLIQRLNVKTGVEVAVRNLTYYIYR
jgi:hypothetical protein